MLSLFFQLFNTFIKTKLGGYFLKVLEACPVYKDSQRDQAQGRAVPSHLMTSGRPLCLAGVFSYEGHDKHIQTRWAFSLQHKVSPLALVKPAGFPPSEQLGRRWLSVPPVGLSQQPTAPHSVRTNPGLARRPRDSLLLAAEGACVRPGGRRQRSEPVTPELRLPRHNGRGVTDSGQFIPQVAGWSLSGPLGMWT